MFNPPVDQYMWRFIVAPLVIFPVALVVSLLIASLNSILFSGF